MNAMAKLIIRPLIKCSVGVRTIDSYWLYQQKLSSKDPNPKNLPEARLQVIGSFLVEFSFRSPMRSCLGLSAG
jgi:hypothetical protein